jgi:hypothetical protein
MILFQFFGPTDSKTLKITLLIFKISVVKDILFKRLNDLVYKNEKENIPMNDFEFIFKDDFLNALIGKCKNLFK